MVGEARRKIRDISLPILGYCGVMLAPLLIAADYPRISDLPHPDSILVLLVYLGVGLFGWRCGITPVVLVGSAGVEVRNPLRRHRIPWETIDHFWADDLLRITLSDGSTIGCWAVQRNTSISGYLRRRSRVDNIAAELERLRQLHGGLPGPPTEV